MNARLQRRLMIGTMLLGAGFAAHAQSTGTEGIIGEKGASQKGSAAPVQRVITPLGVKQPAQGQPAAIQALPPELARRVKQGATGPMYRPTAAKLKQLPADVGKLQSADVGAPFRIGPGTPLGAGQDWTASYASFSNAAGPAYVFSDDRFGQLVGRVGISFQARPGYRYLIDCAVAEAQEFEVRMVVPESTLQTTRETVSAGLVSVVTPPVTTAGMVALGLRASRNQLAFWDWHGCEVTPLRASR